MQNSNRRRASTSGRPSQSQRLSQRDEESTQSAASDSIAATTLVKRALNLSISHKPFTKSDLTHGLKLSKKNESLEMAKNMLTNIYGLELKELANNKYILIVPHGTPSKPDLQALFELENREMRLLSVMLGTTLSIIYFHGGHIREELLVQKILPRLFPDSSGNPMSNLTKLLAKLFEMNYLTKETVHSAEGNEVIYKWGPRSEHECHPSDFVLANLNMMAKRVPASVKKAVESSDVPVE